MALIWAILLLPFLTNVCFWTIKFILVCIHNILRRAERFYFLGSKFSIFLILHFLHLSSVVALKQFMIFQFFTVSFAHWIVTPLVERNAFVQLFFFFKPYFRNWVTFFIENCPTDFLHLLFKRKLIIFAGAYTSENYNFHRLFFFELSKR